jgi:hypothetical protein
MKTKVKVEQTIQIDYIRIEVPVRYDDEDIPYDFPLRENDTWHALINIDTGEVIGWPKGKSGDLHMKVCDEGTYTLTDAVGGIIAAIEQNYVPNGVVPGSYGDYIELHINADGIITNWPKHPDVSEFFKDE